MTEQNFISNSSRLPVWSIILFVVVLLSTVWLFVYNWFVEKNISEIEKNISEIEKNIANINKNKQVQIYNLIYQNKKTIDTLNKRNKIVSYIEHINSLSEIYWLNFSGFSMNNWVIKTKVTSNSIDNDSIAYQKVVSFISNYKDNENFMFDIWFINSFDGMDSIKFNLEFSLK